MNTNLTKILLDGNALDSRNNANGSASRFIPYTIEELEKDMVDSNSEVKDPQPAIYVGGKIFTCTGEIGIVGGKEKAGKSNILIQFVGTALMKIPPSEADDYPVRCEYSEEGGINYIDTEQGKSKTKKFYKNIQQFIETNEKIPNLRCFSLAEYHTARERLDRLKSLLYRYPDTRLWIIDHAADFIKSTNNEELSNEQLSWLNSVAKELDTVFLIVMHENPGQSDKLRGHFGSEGQRKCGGALTVKKDKKNKVHSIECKNLRNDEDFESIILEWNKSLERLVPVDQSRAEKIKKNNDPTEILKKMAKRCTLGYEHISYQELVRRIHNNFTDIEGKQKSLSTAKARVKEMLKHKIINQDHEGKYHMLTAPVPLE